MPVRKTKQADDPIVTTPVTEVVTDFSDPRIRKTIQDLTDTMRSEGLVGMAAPQIGITLPIFVTEIRKTKFRNEGLTPLQVFINPTLSNFSTTTNTDYEGCGSVEHAGLFGLVTRPDKVTVSAHDENGQVFSLDTDGLLARLIQHEYDHLQGELFIDKVVDKASLIDKETYLERKGFST